MLDIIRKEDYFSWLNDGFYHDQRPRLKSAQDAFILSLLKGRKGLKIAEVGGGDSRVLKILSDDNECWNIDKFEGLGQGPTVINKVKGVRVVESYLGDFSKELPEGYFDCVFSISVIEHIQFDVLENFFKDIERILKPGGVTMHAIDLYLSDDYLGENAWRKYLDILDKNCKSMALIGKVELAGDIKYHASMVSDPDINMWKRNNLVPKLAKMRETSQCVSLKVGWRKIIEDESQRNGEDVLIYQMGKVGSSTIKKTLKSEGFQVKHFHYLKGDFAGTDDPGLLILSIGSEGMKNYRGRIITLTRDPVARNLSAFFQNIDMFGVDLHNGLDIDELIRIFFARYNHRIPLDWFDNEFKVSTEVDIYKYDFPKELGYQTLEYKQKKILILKVELEDVVKKDALGQFFNFNKPLEIQFSNVGSQKEYANIYKLFLKNIRFPSEYLEEAYSSKYVRHFYSEDEINEFRGRWIVE